MRLTMACSGLGMGAGKLGCVLSASVAAPLSSRLCLSFGLIEKGSGNKAECNLMLPEVLNAEVSDMAKEDFGETLAKTDTTAAVTAIVGGVIGAFFAGPAEAAIGAKLGAAVGGGAASDGGGHSSSGDSSSGNFNFPDFSNWS